MTQKNTPSIQKISHPINPVKRLYKLLQVNFLPEAIFQVLEKEAPATTLLLINHHDRYLSLSNDTHYIFLLPVVKQEVMSEIKLQMDFIPTRKKLVAQLELNEDLSSFKNQASLTVQQIKNQAVKNGVPKNNIFLILLEELFQKA